MQAAHSSLSPYDLVYVECTSKDTRPDLATKLEDGQTAKSDTPTPATHRVALRCRGPKDAPYVMLCVHGLTRTSGDFEFYSHYLTTKSNKWRVVAMDVVGRGASDWLYDKSLYSNETYAGDVMVVLGKIRETLPSNGKIFYTGTSMGGLIAMGLCGFLAQAGMPAPFDALIINDVGPFIPKAGMRAVAEYLLEDRVFETDKAARDMVWNHYGPLFGKHGVPAQIKSETTDDAATENSLQAVFCATSVYEDPADEKSYMEVARAIGAQRDLERDRATGRFTGAGKWKLDYDHAGLAKTWLSTPLEDIKDLDLWALYDAVKIPTLLLRGGKSVLLTAETAREMTQRGPCAEEIVYEDAGHVPPLYLDSDNDLVYEWIQKTLAKLTTTTADSQE